uniref:Uncharacterized protein n=1 Tax=Cacopsylla melanoneura TaxID=428564 RepID=A0A8D8RR40_9HEMI
MFSRIMMLFSFYHEYFPGKNIKIWRFFNCHGGLRAPFIWGFWLCSRGSSEKYFWPISKTFFCFSLPPFFLPSIFLALVSQTKGKGERRGQERGYIGFLDA